MSELFTFQSAATAHTFTFNFPPDKVVFNNLTGWTSTAGKLPVSIWWKDQTTTAHAFQMKVIDSAAAQSFNFVDLSTNGFTVADTDGGQSSSHKLVSAVSLADPCVITTSVAHGFQTNQIVRFTNLGDVGVTNNGSGQLNNNRYSIVVLNSTTFSLKSVESGEPVDSAAFTAYVSGGKVCLETHVISLNNPQVSPYAVTPYVPNPFAYDPVLYKLTAGTGVLGTDNDIFNIEVYKFGQITALGDIA